MYPNDTILYSTPQPLSFIYGEMDKITEKFRGEAQTWYLSDKNTSGHHLIKAIRLQVGERKEEDMKYIIMVAALDPTAWYTAMIALNLIVALLNDCFYTVPLLTELVWIIVPVANPDGYSDITNQLFQGQEEVTTEATEMEDGVTKAPEETTTEGDEDAFPIDYQPDIFRTRKNVNRHANDTCVGINLDRNFPFHYGEKKFTVAKESISCEDEYPGPYPFSEQETVALKDLLDKYQPKIKMFFHLNGNPETSSIFYPWGFTTSRPYNVKMLSEWTREASDRVRRETNAEYLALQRAQNDMASGNMADYVMGYLGINHTYVVEPTGHQVPMTGEDISAQIEQVEVITMEMGRMFHEKGGSPPALAPLPLLLVPVGVLGAVCKAVVA